MLHASIEAFAHATESVEKVAKALLSLVPSRLRDKVEVSYEAVSGHYDNPITILRAELRGEEAEAFLRFLADNMDDRDKSSLRATLGLRVDESGNLYLRFDKFAAFEGKVKLIERGEAIKVKVYLPLRRRGNAWSLLAEVGLIK